MKYFYKENLELQNIVDSYFKYIGYEFKKEHLDDISIILLGSMSRNEASWGIGKNGKYILFSDLEFLIIYPHNFRSLNKIDSILCEAKKTVLGDINDPLFHIDYSFVCERGLKKLEKKILIFDANCFGRTVVGKDRISELPIVSIKNINPLDIKDVLSHRLFSVLYYGVPLKNKNEIEQYKYVLAKNSLDLMTPLLFSKGIICSGFNNKLNEVKKLEIDYEIKKYFCYCLNVKYGVQNDYSYEIIDMERMFSFLISLIQSSFKCPLGNLIINAPAIFRRKLGVFKRCILARKIVISQKHHLFNMMNLFQGDKTISYKAIMSNYILNGYPKISRDIGVKDNE